MNSEKSWVSRRQFLMAGAAGAGLGLGLPLIHAAERAGKKIPMGVQLYSVRFQCEKDLPGVLEAIGKMGYKGVEFAGYYGRDAKTLRKLLDANGLVCCGTHAQWPTVQQDQLKATIEFNKIIGNKYLIVPSMKQAGRDEWLARAEYYNKVADQLKPEGMLIGYHAHGHDFEKVGDSTAWDLFFGNTKPEVVMQLDTGNCMGAGADPVAVLQKYPKRAVTVHLKEHGGPKEAVIGEGEVKWDEIFKILESNGITEWYIVEHERGGPDPIGDIRKCLENLKKMGKA